MKSRHAWTWKRNMQRRIRSYVLTNCRSLDVVCPISYLVIKENYSNLRVMQIKVSRFYAGMIGGIENKITRILRHFTVYHWKPLPCHDVSSTTVVRQLNSFLFTWKLHNKVIFSVCWYVNFCYMHAWSISTLNKNVYYLNLPRSSVSRISPVDQVCLEI